ncbi:hypothetical protein [uncultured Winogradskyella sp.]|uniref:hypothetical protein n=1 Tax=uncultured Winogradskyella sp. TaxID=395353 RepID=UPI0030DC4BF4|tara:strand:- start:28214 stop:28678 length:465 start_codon:yes stop_codon:yes gene_type:complete
MKKAVLVLFALFIGLNLFGQRRGRNTNNIPQTNREPSEQQIAKQKRQVEERKQAFVANFLTTLEADDFQKEIIKQTIITYYDAKIAILKTRYERQFDLEKDIKGLYDMHFKDLEELISESDMAKIKEMIKGNFDEKEIVKEKRKKKKKKRRKKD